MPRDPGEWLFMAALMAVLMAGSMLGFHALRSHLRGAHQGTAAGLSGLVRPASWVIQRLLSLGIQITILGPMMLLTVPGRRSGRLRTLPVDVHRDGDRRYLVATHGMGSWVLNLRARGEGVLSLGSRRETVSARELSPEEAGPVIRTVLRNLVVSDGFRGRAVRSHLGVVPGSPLEDYVRAARTHPVFELRPVSVPSEAHGHTHAWRVRQ